MEFRERKLTISEAKEIDLVYFLSKSGYEPSRIRGADYWYLSPLRDEKTPSFKVNRNLNRWYDHGIGKGGNMVDFAVCYWGCDISEALQKLSGEFSFQQPVKLACSAENPVKKIRILGDFSLASPALLHYLSGRCIPITIADKFCREIRYELGSKTWYGIGFKNDLGGYELRSTYHKLSSSPKGISTIKNGAEQAVVFEGFFDFLSYLVICYKDDFKSKDYIVLNSLSFLQKSKHLMDSYKSVALFFDNDTAGENDTGLALSWGNPYNDQSTLYTGFDDLNHWLVKSPDAKKHRNAVFTANSRFNGRPPDS